MLVFILLKMKADIDIYQLYHSLEGNNMSPSLLAGGLRINFYNVLLLLMSFVLCSLGFKFKNDFRILSLITNIVGIIYLLIPISFLLII